MPLDESILLSCSANLATRKTDSKSGDDLLRRRKTNIRFIPLSQLSYGFETSSLELWDFQQETTRETSRFADRRGCSRYLRADAPLRLGIFDFFSRRRFALKVNARRIDRSLFWEIMVRTFRNFNNATSR